MDKCILDNYFIEKKIGSGSFGDVYLVTDKETNEQLAAKVEEKKKSSRLYDEFKIYKRIHRKQFNNGLPKIHNYIQTPKFNILIMDLLGADLEKLFNDKHKKFKLETVLLLGINIISLLEQMHNSGYIHRDIKPNNFMVGYNDKGKIYIMDLGLSKKYISNGKHIPLKTDKSLTGTARYTSINVHMGMEPSRRDDMESVGYMLIYFLKGKLPWQGLKKEKGVSNIENIGEVKLCTSLDRLCKDLPECFKKYLAYCREIKYDGKPDYNYLKNLFIETSHKMKINLKYEWNN